MEFPLKAVDQDWHRLIPSKFPPIDIYERLRSPELTAAAHRLEDLTNPRVIARERLLEGAAPPQLGSARLQNWNLAPFAYKDPQGSRFLRPGYGVLEVAGDVRGALAWAVERRETFMARTREPASSLDMRLLNTRIRGEFADVTSLPADLDQQERWRIGQRLYNNGISGLLFTRPGITGAPFLAVFNGSTLSTSVQATHYLFVWDGQAISSVYDFGTGETIGRVALLGAPAGKAAA